MTNTKELPEKTDHIYRGALHIHTSYSDGTGSIAEIVAAAKKAGLSWIIITDHNNLDGLKNNQEGWHDDIAVIIGEEISPDKSNHYLALNIKQPVSYEMEPENYINEVKKQGGIGFIAHPDENPNRKNSFKPLRWTDWNISGFDGIEIWNWLSDWVDNYDTKQKFYCYFKKNEIVTGPTKNVLNWWDNINNSTSDIIPAVGGIDVHALHYKHFGIKFVIFPYFDSFKTVTNYLHLDENLSNDFDKAKIQIYDALKRGKNTIINRVWNNKQEKFDFYIKNSDFKAFPGNTIKLNDTTKLTIQVEKKSKIKLIHNGQLIKEFIDEKEVLFEDIKPGKYRVEVFYKNHPWIFTNPIHVI